jgi:hypothetical protein
MRRLWILRLWFFILATVALILQMIWAVSVLAGDAAAHAETEPILEAQSNGVINLMANITFVLDIPPNANSKNMPRRSVFLTWSADAISVSSLVALSLLTTHDGGRLEGLEILQAFWQELTLWSGANSSSDVRGQYWFVT